MGECFGKIKAKKKYLLSRIKAKNKVFIECAT